MQYNKPRGTEDWLPEVSENYRALTDLLFLIAKINGYREIKTPIFESSELFIRSVGETSDIVKKEFYSFKDKGDREMVLRPEGTAGVIRAIVEEKLINKLPSPIKLSYSGPMFRYERPQSGRLRQFNQFGIECINTNSIMDDIDTLMLASSILVTLGIKSYKININNIGDFTSRNKWINELRTYFQQYKDQLSELSQSRIESNPLRILDDKEDGKKDFVKNAPKIDKYLSDKEKADFKLICDTLKTLNLNYKIDQTLVRGLDYYTNFIFEINSTDKRLEGQPTLIGGGRYANLVKELGGPECSCIGFALGIERLSLALEYEKIKLVEPSKIDVVVACFEEQISQQAAIIALAMLRSSGISAVCKFDATKLVKSFNYAESLNARFVLILGMKELKEQKVVIKNQKTMKQETIPLDKIVEYIKAN
ncbi:MAG: histidine--tRNA ligase [Mycoplasmataceae bacterium]|nr:histidine--tRNA ligase [Mycoplasmataceae bacterium]